MVKMLLFTRSGAHRVQSVFICRCTSCSNAGTVRSFSRLVLVIYRVISRLIPVIYRRNRGTVQNTALLIKILFMADSIARHGLPVFSATVKYNYIPHAVKCH